MVKWFLSENDEVRGPFSEEQIQAQVDAQFLSEKCLVWTKGMEQWKNVKYWNTQLKNQAITPQQIQQRRLWHYAFDGQSYGPIPYASLVNELKKLGDRANEVQLWTKGMKTWAPLYDFHEVMDGLEINRRLTARADIEGQVVISFGDKQLIGQLRSISQGGFGADRMHGLLPGQQVSVELRSKALYEPFTVKAEVRYLGDSGYAGFLFTSLNREYTSAIIQYVKSQSKVNIAAAA